MTIRLVHVLLLASLALFGNGLAQSGSARFELGWQGAVVADAWNPLRLVLRDLPPVELEVVIDQGSLRTGPVLTTYRVSISESRGVRVFEDDLFVPEWRSLAWTVRSVERTIASGAMGTRLRDATPLTLLLSSDAGSWLSRLAGDWRLHEITVSALATRGAAYSGVHALLVDGTTPAPSTESLVAAAAAGVVVVLVQPLPESHLELQHLISGGPRRIGAGWLISARHSEVSATLTGFVPLPVEAMALELASVDARGDPPPLTRLAITGAGALYALVVLALLRFGGTAGLPTALVVAALASGAGWSSLRPDRPVVEEHHDVVVASGGLGVSLDTLALRSLPGGPVQLERTMRLVGRTPHRVGPEGTRLQLARWQREILLGRPHLVNDVLGWDGDVLVNRGERTLTDVLVVGKGFQPSLAAGERRQVVAAEEDGLPDQYDALAVDLPLGAAIARAGETLFVALPDWETGL